MTISAIASRIYQTAKKAAKGVWNWRLEWSRAMKQAWRRVMVSNFVTLECGDFCEVYAIEGDDNSTMKHEKSRNGLGSTVTTWIPEEVKIKDYSSEFAGFRI